MASRKLREASIKTYLVTVVFTVVFVNIKKLHQKRLWMGKEGYVKSLDLLKDYDAVNEDIFSTQYAVRRCAPLRTPSSRAAKLPWLRSWWRWDGPGRC